MYERKTEIISSIVLSACRGMAVFDMQRFVNVGKTVFSYI